MVDETNNAGEASTGTIEVNNASGVSSLESYIGANGPMNWRECLALFHDVCFKMETTAVDSVQIGELSIHSFIVRRADTAGGISIEIPSGAEALDPRIAKLSKPTEHSFKAEAYMSPEKCLERPVNRRSDIYSLGCVIYHCLTGAPPFTHRDPEKLKEMQTIDYALPPGRRSQRRVIPDEVDMVISNCLEKDPARRFKNAGVLRANIGRVLQLEDESDEPPSNSAKFAEFAKRKRKVFISVAALVAVTAGIGCWSLNITSSDDFHKLIKRTVDRRRNKFYLGLEHGPQFIKQAEFENGKMEPDKNKDPIYIKVKDEDQIIFATTVRKTMKEALEEAVRRGLIIFKADLIGQDLSGIKVPGGNFDHSFLVDCNLDEADLKGSYLLGSIFAGSSMKGANLSSVNSPEAVFQGCNLENANLSSAILLNCDFSKSNLKNADLSYSKVGNSTFEGADLTGAKLKGAAITEAALETANLTAEQKSGIEIISAPLKNAKQLGRSARGVNPGAPTVNTFKEQNPFSNPLEGTAPFGPSKDEPIGMNIDLNHLPPAPPRKRGAPHPPPLQQALPGQKIMPPNPAPGATNAPASTPSTAPIPAP